MKNLKALLKLDMELIKPYWRWLLMFFGISILTSVFMGGGIAFILNLFVFGATILAFPFENVEKGNMETLYAVLPTNRKSMIFARYIFAVIFMLIVAAIAVGVGALIDFIYMQIPNYVQNPVYPYYPEYIRIPRLMELDMYANMLFTMLALGFAMYMITFSVQTPFFYKYGYKKGRIFMWIPIIVIMLVSLVPSIVSMVDGPNINLFNMMLGVNANTPELAQQARLITTLVSLGAGILFPIGSFFLSRKMYLRKDI